MAEGQRMRSQQIVWDVAVRDCGYRVCTIALDRAKEQVVAAGARLTTESITFVAPSGDADGAIIPAHWRCVAEGVADVPRPAAATGAERTAWPLGD